MSTSWCLSRKAKNGSSLSPTMCRRPMFNPNKSAKSIEKKRCARPIYAQSYATKSPVLMISLSSKVSSMLWCKSSRPMVRVCLNPQMCRRRTLWAFFIYKIETAKGRVVYVVYVVVARTEIEQTSRKAFFDYWRSQNLSTRGGPSSDAGRASSKGSPR